MRTLPIPLLAALAAGPAIAHGDAAHSAAHAAAPRAISPERHAWGREGDPARAARTVRVDMADTMRFTPDALTVRRGETVRFVVRNRGAALHEFVLGTGPALAEHAELMKRHPGMEHDAPYMAHVAPGGEQTLAWTFDRAGTFVFGCLIPGHWEAGMKGSVTVRE